MAAEAAGGPLAADHGTDQAGGFDDVLAALEPFWIDPTDNLVSGGKGESNRGDKYSEIWKFRRATHLRSWVNYHCCPLYD